MLVGFGTDEQKTRWLEGTASGDVVASFAPIGTFQLVQAMIADMQTGVLAGRALVRDAARMWVDDEDRRIAPSAAKLFCTEMVGKVADLAVQVHDGAGYMRDVAAERI